MKMFFDWIFLYLVGVGTGWVTMAYMQLAKALPEESEDELEQERN